MPSGNISEGQLLSLRWWWIFQLPVSRKTSFKDPSSTRSHMVTITVTYVSRDVKSACTSSVYQLLIDCWNKGDGRELEVKHDKFVDNYCAKAEFIRVSSRSFHVAPHRGYPTRTLALVGRQGSGKQRSVSSTTIQSQTRITWCTILILS